MKKTLLSVTAAALIATSGFAALSPSVATDGTGDMLIAPAFHATGTFSTKLKVVNTNVTHSVFMRVVVRDYAHSMEVDFPILLSPGDVWDATIKANSAGLATLTSTDDSNHPSLASKLSAGVVLPSINTKAVGKFERGYIELLPIAMYDEGSMNKVDKATTLKDRFTALEKGDVTGAIAVDDDSVAGFVTVVNESTANPASMTIPMLALEDVNDYVMRGTPMQLGEDTVMTEYLVEEAAGVKTVYQTEVMNLLKKSTFAVPYSNAGANSVVQLTYWNDLSGYGVHNQDRKFSYFVYDMSENKNQVVTADFSGQEVGSYTGESKWEQAQVTVQKLITEAGASFTDGWIYAYNFKNVYNSGTGNVAGGTPTVIPTMMSAEKVGTTYNTNWVYLPAK